jgi:4-amino-4-deoxy-L-arabinose transferase-like glycosyltransferase
VQLLTKHGGLFIVLALTAVLLLNGIWSYKEFVRAESYFALGARLMIERGDWLTPHAPDEGLLNKPPLTYWLIGLSYKIMGPSYGAARLPSIIAALALLALIYWFGLQTVGPRAGIIAASTLATSYLFFSFARMAMSDMLLTLFAATSILSFIALIRSNAATSRTLVAVAYVTLGLAVLTKGPVALALVLVPVVIELLIRRSREDVRKLQPVMGLLVLAIFSVPYFVLVYFRLGASPIRFFFIGENVQRFTGALYGWSRTPIWYEFAAFFGDFAPWSLLIPVAIWLDYKHRSSRIASETLALQSSGSAKRVLYLWLGWTIVLFSISNFRLDYYLLPAMPAAALILGETFGSSERRRFWQPILIGCAVIAMTIFALQLTAGQRFHRFLPAPQLVASVPPGRTWLISSGAKEWANDVAFNLPEPHEVDRSSGSDETTFLENLKGDANGVALVREQEYVRFAAADPQLKILAAGETYGHGGLNLQMLLHRQRERLLVIGHER